MQEDHQKELKRLEEAHKELYGAYLQLCKQFEEKMPVWEFGFGLIRLASKMLLDSAPSHDTAFNTISRAVHEAEKWYKEESKSEILDN